MSQALSTDSRYRPAAAQFGAALARRMRERKIGTKTLGPQCKVAISAIGMYRGGLNVPSLQVAQRLADALQAPELLLIVQEARTKACRRCQRVFVAVHHTSRYCSFACRTLGAPGTGRSASKPEQAVQLLRGEMLRVGPVRKQSIGQALTLLDDVLEPVRQASGLSDAYSAAVAAMCADCEPEGLCRTAECPLRPVSPLPMAGQQVGEARRAVGPTPESRQKAAASMRVHHAAHPEHRQPFVAAGARYLADKREQLLTRARAIAANERATVRQRQVAQAVVAAEGHLPTAAAIVHSTASNMSRALLNAEARVAA